MKKFTDFLVESIDVQAGQAVQAHEIESHNSNSSAIENEKTRALINRKLSQILDTDNRSLPNNVILAPEIGFERIRKVLHTHAIDLPAILSLDQEGGEEVFEVNQFGTPYGPLPSGQYGEVRKPYYLYVYYFLNDDGYYDFFAQIVDENELEEYTSITGEEESDED
jgi:hypothetical protein